MVSSCRINRVGAAVRLADGRDCAYRELCRLFVTASAQTRGITWCR